LDRCTPSSLPRTNSTSHSDFAKRC
jgi:hypothetical protein